MIQASLLSDLHGLASRRPWVFFFIVKGSALGRAGFAPAGLAFCLMPVSPGKVARVFLLTF
jgi:hypothetical protein